MGYVNNGPLDVDQVFGDGSKFEYDQGDAATVWYDGLYDLWHRAEEQKSELLKLHRVRDELTRMFGIFKPAKERGEKVDFDFQRLYELWHESLLKDDKVQEGKSVKV